MKKRIRALSMLTVLVGLTVIPASALSGVYDEAGMFSADESDSLTSQIAELEAQTNGWEVAIATTDDAHGMSAQEYAEAIWDAEYHEHGALALLDFDNGEVYISCTGDAMSVYTDARVESMLDAMFEYIPQNAYYDASVAFLDRAAYFYQAGMETDEPVYHVQPEDSVENFADDPVYEQIERETGKNYPLIVGIAVLGGLAAGGIAVGIAMAKYRLKFPDRSYEVRKHAQLQLTERRDDVIGRVVTHRRIPRNGDHPGGHGGGRSGGGTTIHHSSGGHVHSGGGRRM